MRNLELLNVKRCKIGDERQNITAITINEETAYVIEDNFLYSHTLETGHRRLLSEEKFNCITPLVFLEFQNQLWFGTGEEFIFYCPETQELNSIPAPAKFETALWNPTEEAVAIVFNDKTVGIYSFDLDDYTIYSIAESNLEAAVPQSVYVGWGSEKTQFRGSEGKLRKIETDDKYEKPPNDKTPKISWRGNGEMFVINYWHENRRTFKVFEYPCKPAYRVEEAKGLQAPISWRPTGNMIACSVCIDDKYSVVIFEKNGCKRFGFDIAYSSEIEEIVWSPNGKVLALKQKVDDKETITLYTNSNYKWYLKQTLEFAQENSLVSFEFVNASKDLTLLRVFTQKEVTEYLFRSTVHRSMFNDENCTTCAVIDSKKLLLTVFGKENCPPPMFSDSVNLETPINFVAFHNNKSLLGVIDVKYNVVVYDYIKKTPVRSFQIENTDSGDNIPLPLHHFYWFEDTLKYLKSPEKNCKDLQKFSIKIDNEKVTFERSDTFDSDLFEIIIMPVSNDEIFIHKNKVCVKRAQKNSGDDFELNLPNTAVCTSAVRLKNDIYVFSLTQNNKFFINDKLVTNQVTSFIIHDDKYLILTTSDNNLYCIRLNEKQIGLLFKKIDFKEQFYSRSIEQSAVIICAITNSADVVLQMPRGNIEIISCRLIAIDLLERLLKNNSWEEALYFIRTQRLNVNLLIDLNAQRFMENIPEFVAATKTPSVLNAFTQEITDENTLELNYLKCTPGSVQKLQNKRQLTCARILDYLEKHNYVDYITSIIMICIHHFSIEKGLIYLQDLLKKGEADKNLEEAAKAAMQILKTYVNEDVLYKKSLLLYDTNLAWYIARNCQMDPCEYEPFLLKLKSMSDVRQRYEINVLMEKPEVAIKYLIRTPDVEDKTILDFAYKYNVGHVIYDYVSPNTPIFTELSRMYAKKLHDKKNYNESATIYARSNLWMDALKEYISALNWKRALYAMNKLNLPLSERKKYAENLSESLIKSNKIIEAGLVYEDGLKDYETSIKILIENGCFTDAVRVAQKYSVDDVKEKEINEAIRTHGKNLVNEINDMEEKFQKYFNRIKLVRKEKIARCKNEAFSSDTNINGGHLEDADIYSDTESKSSRSTGSRKTSASVRNLRRRQAKIESLKEGGVYEDIALLRALHILSARICTFGDEIEEFCLVCLEQEDMFNDVKYLYDSLTNLQENVRAASVEVWPKFFSDELKTDASIEEVALYENVPLLDECFRRPPKEIDAPVWKLAIFGKETQR